MVVTEGELSAMEARCNAATPGPWKASIEGRDHTSGCHAILRWGRDPEYPDLEISGATVADYDFIAAARQDLPSLIDEVRRLRTRLLSAGIAP